MAGTFEIKKGTSGKFHFNLKAANGEVILTSETYNERAAAEDGIAAVRANSGNDDRYKRKESKKGEPYFVLTAANGEVIGTSEMYSSEPAMEKGIASVKANGATTTIQDLTDKS
jgi:uncharacterized protein YegP (UPF0339 family)